eukprot:m.486322 g.486322  ORF g.486322 m.486322 type:complete len:74 (+) comp24318_c0_seq1:178-399(+)
MDSIDEACTPHKHKYDACFNVWYSEKYLQGKTGAKDNPCTPLLEEYSICVKRALKEKGIEIEELSKRPVADED